jgi:hypothetical protein
VPEYIKTSGINLFSSRSTSMQRIMQAIWFGSVTSKEKLAYATQIAKDINILTYGERLGNLFVLSLVHRCFSILASSTKLYIDNSNIKPIYKYALSFTISALPSLFLIYVVGYPPTELILNACVTQATSIVISYCSLRVGNYLRSLDLISDTKDLNKTAYLSKLLVYSAIDIALTLAWHGKELYTDPFKMHDTYHILQYCMETKKSQFYQSVTMIYPSTPLISIADKFIWLTGRVAVDSLVCISHALGRIKDIRSPFIDAFSIMEKKLQPVKVKSYTTSQPQRLFIAKDHRRSVSGTAPIATLDSIPSISFTETTKSTRIADPTNIRTTPKIKTRKTSILNPSENEILEETTQEQSETTAEITLNNITFYKIEGDRIPKNTWGVINVKKSHKDTTIHERSLSSSGHVSNQRSAIKFLPNLKAYEIRPKGIGDRILGKLLSGTTGFKQLFLLGEAMTIYEQMKKLGNNIEPNVILFNTRVKHDSIGRANI